MKVIEWVLSGRDSWLEAHGIVSLGVETCFGHSDQSQAVLGGNFEADTEE